MIRFFFGKKAASLLHCLVRVRQVASHLLCRTDQQLVHMEDIIFKISDASLAIMTLCACCSVLGVRN